MLHYDPIRLRSAEGDYQGDGTVCVPNPCLLPRGACCDENLVCHNNFTEAMCFDVGGVWHQGQDCPVPDCEPITGACCDTPAQSCTDGLTFDECMDQHTGPWFPDAECVDIECPIIPCEDCTPCPTTASLTSDAKITYTCDSPGGVDFDTPWRPSIASRAAGPSCSWSVPLNCECIVPPCSGFPGGFQGIPHWLGDVIYQDDDLWHMRLVIYGIPITSLPDPDPCHNMNCPTVATYSAEFNFTKPCEGGCGFGTYTLVSISTLGFPPPYANNTLPTPSATTATLSG